MSPFHDFVKDARWQKVLVYEQHELKLMWTHVQLAWWWYLELRRDRDVICIMRYEPNLVLGWVIIELTSIQSIEEDLRISICPTTIFEKGGGLIAVTGIMQTIAVIVNIIASWTIIIVMHIIVTLKNGRLLVNCHRMMMSRTLMTIGEWGVEQTQHGAAKSMRNFVHSGAVMTEGIHFEYSIWASIIVPIALIHSEHVFAYITEVLRAMIRWSW
jgi:hypothetical protein